MEKTVNIDELKPGVETDRLVAEAIDIPFRMQYGVCFITKPDGVTKFFQPAIYLKDAFWAAEQAGLFDIPGFSCELVKIGKIDLESFKESWIKKKFANALFL